MNKLYLAILNECDESHIKNLIQENRGWVNERCASNGGFTPLHCAISKACRGAVPETIVKLLLEAGADLEIGDNLSYTPLQVACIASGPSTNLCHVELLLQFGASVKRPENARESPLHLAIFNKNAALVQLLLEYGADIHEKDYAGRTCLECVTPDDELYHLMVSFHAFEIKEPHVCE